MQVPQQTLPTLQELEQAIVNLTVQRSQAKDVVEQCEKQLMVFSGQVQLLRAQLAQEETPKD
jgi:hypothetical protein